MGDGEDEPARWPQHLMQLPKRGFQSTHVLEDHVRDDEVECPGPERGEVGEVGLNESAPKRGPSLERVRHRQETGGQVHADDASPLLGQDPREVPVSATGVKDVQLPDIACDGQKHRVDDPLAVDVALLGVALDPPSRDVVPPLSDGGVRDSVHRAHVTRPPLRDLVRPHHPAPCPEIRRTKLPRMSAFVLQSVQRRVKSRVPRTAQREVVRPSPKAPPDRPLLGRTLDAYEGIATRTVGDAVKDPRLAAFVADEPPVKVAPRESGLADVCRAPRPVLGSGLPNSDAVAAPVRRHGPTRNPETPNYALESGLRLAPA